MITAIEAALDIGAVSVTDENGRTVDYGSRKDMLQALGRLKTSQDHASAGRGFAINTFKSSGARG
jgi:hypothetical protein